MRSKVVGNHGGHHEGDLLGDKDFTSGTTMGPHRLWVHGHIFKHLGRTLLPSDDCMIKKDESYLRS